MVCWCMEQRASAAIYWKEFTLKICHFLTDLQRQGGKDEDWHDCSLHAGERLCCCVPREAVWTQTHYILCLSLTGIQEWKVYSCRQGLLCVCSWQLSSQCLLCCTAQQMSQSNCVGNSRAENSWSVKTYGTLCVLWMPTILFNWPPSSNFLAPLLCQCMIFQAE